MYYPRTIYAIKHNKTGRVYVGSSENADNRIKQHFNALRRGKHIVEDMQDDYEKHGDDFTVLYLDTAYDVGDKNLEFKWMKHLNSHIRGIGYNYKDQHFKTRLKDPRVDYRNSIITLVKKTDDLSLLDLVYKILKKST